MGTFDASATLPAEPDHTAAVRLHPRQPPPAHYYAANLLTVVETVLQRYGDILSPAERDFGTRIEALSESAQRLLARLIGRTKPLIREDSLLGYAEVADVQAALAELAKLGLIERRPAAPMEDLLDQLTAEELRTVFWEVAAVPKTSKAVLLGQIQAHNHPRVARWRVGRVCPWLRLRDAEHLALYQLLFFGGRGQDMTTFVMRDLGVYRFEPVPLSPQTRQFADRVALRTYLDLLDAADAISALGARPDPGSAEAVATLLKRLWTPLDNRLLERRRSRALNRLGRNLERAGDFDAALACYQRSTHAPARERRMRILHRLGDGEGVENVRAAILKQPQTTLEADFAQRFACRFRRQSAPTVERPLDVRPASIEAHALALLTARGGKGWHLENDLPMAVFALAFWHWIFAPVEGAFVNAFQAGPVDLFWPDFFAARADLCDDPLAAPLKPRLRGLAGAKAGVVNRLFNWRRCSREVIRAVLEAIPEADLRALVEIVREDLPGRRSGFPDLTVLYGPGEYEFVEVKGPGDQLQIHQRLWIQALRERGLPVRVLRFRLES